ncbi:hypothetical protein GOB93_05915 [Acetobacter musti]|mgnify:CR=1 FL=1|uniref:F5/8 type C domain-containing protein n=1 Tax=Acetobacter musti TaxID=864732 RepID=A0ABX0JLI9_9PROT|nr:glycosyltransferase family 2 protein [Acetobacter musti]NHN84179.1 hypothetical protein [Acetobacter musti]
MKKNNYSLVTCARWEKDCIQEWLVYHRSIGFDHVYIYCNDDRPDDLYEKILPFNIGTEPFVTFLFHPQKGDQNGMYRHFLQHFRHETERFMFLDVDEFVCIRNTNNIDALVQNGLNDCDDIVFNWVWFGNSGFVERPGGSVLLNYVNRSAGVFILTKHLIKSSVFDEKIRIENLDAIFHHRISPASHPGLTVKNVLGEDYTAFIDGSDDEKAHYLYQENRSQRILETACIFHYAFKSEKDLVARARRSTEGSFSGQKAWKDLYDSGNLQGFFAPLNAVKDTYLRRYWMDLLLNGNRSTTNSGNTQNIKIERFGIADQSSVSPWSVGATTRNDAANGINGISDGAYHFHTEHEPDPWWTLTFPDPVLIRSVVIHNRPDVPYRANGLIAEVRLPHGDWREIGTLDSGMMAGSAHNNIFTISPDQPVICDILRLRLPRKEYLHLSQVEVIGDIIP